MKRIRRSRTEPKNVSVRLQERDFWILEALMKMRILKTRQLAALYFDGSCAAANKRLRKLFDAGYICSWLRSLSEDNLYTITRMGIRVLQLEGDYLITDAAPVKLDGQLDQVLAINEVRISLARQLEYLGGAIVWWLSDWDLRKHHRERIIPDALLEIALGKIGSQTISLEVDHNTRSLKRFVAKMRGYAKARDQRQPLYGHTNYMVVVVCMDNATADRYRRSLNVHRFNDWVWMTTLAAIDSQPSIPVWQRPGSEVYYSLRDLLTCPYRKDRFGYILH